MTTDRLIAAFEVFPYQVHVDVERARAHLTDWAGRTGLVGEAARRRFEKADFGWFAAMVYPTADRTGLYLTADWFAWLFMVDDQLDDGAEGRDPDRLRTVFDGMRAVLTGAGPATAPVPAPGVAISSLVDLWGRTAPLQTPRWRRRFTGHLTECLTTAATWEAGNRRAGVVPDPATYIRKRRHTGAIYVCMDLIDVVSSLDVPDAVYDSAPFRAALDAASDVVCWTNDVYSLEKERALGEVHNLVHVLQHHHGWDTGTALDRTCAAIADRIDEFRRAEERLLAGRPEHAEVLARYTAGMRSWMRGNLDWSSRTRRYRDPAAATGYLESALFGSRA
ncbi:terpene synthase family protein [Jidongwangia harbinensis]|uniref:terpene synthase family protein n=1 Tax=Jidongwangia harbinensis TaxID=2878561 RepID=UPI001CD9CAAF|nr:hypothetical protein [Jidongwangia harbinensis]MCA2215081.1 hypothetical protein [Jidongwangia harbinensis]